MVPIPITSFTIKDHKVCPAKEDWILVVDNGELSDHHLKYYNYK